MIRALYKASGGFWRTTSALWDSVPALLCPAKGRVDTAHTCICSIGHPSREGGDEGRIGLLVVSTGPSALAVALVHAGLSVSRCSHSIPTATASKVSHLWILYWLGPAGSPHICTQEGFENQITHCQNAKGEGLIAAFQFLADLHGSNSGDYAPVPSQEANQRVQEYKEILADVITELAADFRPKYD